MGLLTSERSRSLISNVLTTKVNIISFLAYCSGVVWLLLLAHPLMNERTYFSENALIPGIATEEFDLGSLAQQWTAEYRQINANSKGDKRHTWLKEKLRSIGLDPYEQEFKFQYPFNMIGNRTITGKNLYGILRSPHTASTEGLVILTLLRPPQSGQPPTDGSVGLMLALAQHFIKKSVWAKDILFLFAEYEYVGVQAWLDGYHHTTTSPFIMSGSLLGRSGSLQAALALEVPGSSYSYINLRLEGLNGQMPNMDLINLLNRLAAKHHVPTRLHSRSDPSAEVVRQGGLRLLQHNWQTLARAALQQSSCMSTGSHGLFLRYHIEAVTIETVKLSAKSHFDLDTLARVLEGVMRSLNNLLERFHQSFFFYVLPETSRYISIGLYVPPFFLIVSCILSKAISMWIIFQESVKKCREFIESRQSQIRENKLRASTADQSAGLKKKAEKDSKESERDDCETRVKGEERGLLPPGKGAQETEYHHSELVAKNGKLTQAGLDLLFVPESVGEGLYGLVPMVICCHLAGLLLLYGPTAFGSLSDSMKQNMKPSEMITWGVFALFVSITMIPRSLAQKDDMDVISWPLLKIVAMTYYGLILVTISLMNISLAVLLSLVTVPIFTIIHPAKNWFYWTALLLLLLLCSPPFLGILGMWAWQGLNRGSLSGPDLWLVLTNIEEALSSLIVDNALYANWLYTMVCLFLLPCWLMIWGIMWLKPTHL